MTKNAKKNITQAIFGVQILTYDRPII